MSSVTSLWQAETNKSVTESCNYNLDNTDDVNDIETVESEDDDDDLHTSVNVATTAAIATLQNKEPITTLMKTKKHKVFPTLGSYHPKQFYIEYTQELPTIESRLSMMSQNRRLNFKNHQIRIKTNSK